MAKHNVFASSCNLLLILVLLTTPSKTVQSIGVCYGRIGDNLPQPSDVVNLYKSNNIDSMRIYSPDKDALQALSGSGINLIVDVPNDQLSSIAGDSSAAVTWVQNNIVAFSDVSFKYIAVGNEVTGDATQFILPAMQNILAAISSVGLNIKVSTAVSFNVVTNTSPPSQGVFTDTNTMGTIANFLANNGAPLLINIYPYFSYVYGGGQVPLDYALFTASGIVASDPPYQYQNLFDAMVDAAYAALEKVGADSVRIIVSESGWPSDGGDAASTSNAQTYNQHLIDHVGQGTPKKPGAIETYIFAMFNENNKSPGVEQNFGLFYPSMQPVYQISF